MTEQAFHGNSIRNATKCTITNVHVHMYVYMYIYIFMYHSNHIATYVFQLNAAVRFVSAKRENNQILDTENSILLPMIIDFTEEKINSLSGFLY